MDINTARTWALHLSSSNAFANTVERAREVLSREDAIAVVGAAPTALDAVIIASHLSPVLTSRKYLYVDLPSPRDGLHDGLSFRLTAPAEAGESAAIDFTVWAHDLRRDQAVEQLRTRIPEAVAAGLRGAVAFGG